MSPTANSSKHSSQASAASSAATAAIGSSPLTSPERSASRKAWMRSCTSAMKALKCARRFPRTGGASKKRSISIVLPRPTAPKM